MSTDAIALPRSERASRPLVDTLHEWVTTVDHKRLGILYILYALVFLVIGGIEAGIIRIQLIRAHNDFVSPQVFNRMFTMHGTTMIFFVVMPLVFGFANYLLPLMIGARDMAFPRLNAFSFWLMAFGGLLLYFSLGGANGLYGAGNAPDVGWFAYATLASRTLPVGNTPALWTLGLLVWRFGSLATSIRFLPRSVWAHNMFTVGMSSTANTFFVLSTRAIAVPTGIKIFNWLATMWGGKIEFKTPMLFCVAFLFQFLVAGLTGIMLGSAPFNWQLSNSYFVVAHFHYVIVGAILFTIFGAFYYWFPKMSGQMYSETLGKLHFWLFLIGFHLTFDFMHIPGLLGMPRRIYTYEPGRGWDVWNLIVTIGVFFQALGTVVFVVNLVWSYFKGATAGNDPWDAWTLEWSTPSPPPAYNFSVIPTVKSRRPLWDLKHPEDPDWKYE